ncbi:radical SAM family heme chaperone HemW [soil metagenome]
MAGIYLHIPFCKQACHYCDFHFSTSLKHSEDLVKALLAEIKLQEHFLEGEKINTVYFGGGTPSILKIEALEEIFDQLHRYFQIAKDAEITLEANPDDLTAAYLRKLRHTPVNRLSIGVQSFHEADLKAMNRAHNSAQALRCVPEAADLGFENLSIDLIYGIPGSGMQGWQENVKQALQLPVDHLSCYCLTVEAGTALAWQVKKGLTPAVDEDEAASQFEWLLEITETAGIPWYEISNFSKPGRESRHNTAYWNGVPYLGVGPSAHSFNGNIRQWNVKNNPVFIREINKGIIPMEKEILTSLQQFNELILTSLRTRKGLTAESIRKLGGEEAWKELKEQASPLAERGQLIIDSENIRVSTKGMLFADALASSLFKI